MPDEPTGKAHVPFAGKLTELYDVFVDWDGRLGREMPGILARLESVGARKVLDVGCATARHVQALLAAGHDAHGCDPSGEMRARAVATLGEAQRVHAWGFGEPTPPSLHAAAPFDALLAMGNVWPHVLGDAEIERAARAMHELLRPGGLVLLGLKAVACRAEEEDPYLPLLKRRADGCVLWFVRFVDFDLPQAAAGARVCDFHMAVLAGEGDAPCEAVHHASHRWRVWSPEQLRAFFEAAGFREVAVSASLAKPTVEPRGEDVFVSARTPG
jgi:SAM-dependent methyltransferase